MSSDYFHKNDQISPFAHFANRLRGKEIRRRDTNEVVRNYQVFNKHTWTYTLDELINDKNEKYYLVNKKMYIPPHWQNN